MDIEQKLSAVVGIYFQLVEKCEGDISNLEVTLKQDESAVKVFENLLIIADEIDNDTSGKFVSKDLRFILDWVRTISKLRYGSGRRIGDILHEVMERYVSDEDEEAVSILDKLASLPSYEPNEWMRRSFLIESIFIRPLSTVPPDLISRLEETMSCFIYGNILAGVTLCRATLKTCLHYKYPNLGWEDSGDKKMSLGMFINDWQYKIAELRNRVDLREKAVQIMDAGNKAVHPGESSSGRYTFDEQLLIDCLNNLKEILEYLY